MMKIVGTFFLVQIKTWKNWLNDIILGTAKIFSMSRNHKALVPKNSIFELFSWNDRNNLVNASIDWHWAINQLSCLVWVDKSKKNETKTSDTRWKWFIKHSKDGIQYEFSPSFIGIELKSLRLSYLLTHAVCVHFRSIFHFNYFDLNFQSLWFIYNNIDWLICFQFIIHFPLIGIQFEESNLILEREYERKPNENVF